MLGLVERLGALQIDSVNVAGRAHYMPGFRGSAPIRDEALEALAWGGKRGRALFEYGAHEASLLPFAIQPLFRWRMARAARGRGDVGACPLRRRRTRRRCAAALAEIRGKRRDGGRRSHRGGASQAGWWGWSDGKKAVEYLFWSGQLAVAGRRGNFERLYDLPERVLPADSRHAHP